MVREDVQFISRGDMCAAWLYLPEGSQGPTGCVVMGHGFSAVRDQRLDSYAERFAQAGLAALVFDYRYLGDSAGTPRGFISPAEQRADYHAAIAYARSRAEVDPNRVAIWGSSFSGGNVVIVAADDPSLAAVVSNCPLMDPVGAFPGLLKKAPVRNAGLMVAALADQIGSWLGRAPRRLPLAADRGVVFLPYSDTVAGMAAITSPQSKWANAVTARSALKLMRHRPITRANDVVVPLLVCICDHDIPAPAEFAVRAAELAPRGEARHYDCGHFDIYHGEWFEKAVADQVDFLTEHLRMTAAADSATT